MQRCRQIYEEANKGLRSCEEKEERLMLLESWRDYEQEFGSLSTRERVRKLLPEKVKRRRKLTAEDGVRKTAAMVEVLTRFLWWCILLGASYIAF